MFLKISQMAQDIIFIMLNLGTVDPKELPNGMVLDRDRYWELDQHNRKQWVHISVQYIRTYWSRSTIFRTPLVISPPPRSCYRKVNGILQDFTGFSTFYRIAMGFQKKSCKILVKSH